MKHLKDKGADVPEAWMFLTGMNEWRKHAAWPPKQLQPMAMYLDAAGRLSTTQPKEPGAFDEYVSDPQRPVPFIGYVGEAMTSDYMTEDQRFASTRTDVLTYRGEPLDRDVVIAGPIKVNLKVSSSGSDSDFIVKVIDVYPNDYPTPAPPPGTPVPPNAVRMGGYQQLVRGEPFRAKFRNSFEKPEPLNAG